MGILAMVGYTMGCYEKNKEWILTPNFNWVMVLAVDDQRFFIYNVIL